ncbi:glutamine--tRNA ligase/YqeY domain fusion protein [Pendulispora albinea]|uniref:Glutamine--tRNA ligase n=1 Tax=Pendulispora albinea TaxID=2741071 RepID=A0ABZ2LVJ6_9BACT
MGETKPSDFIRDKVSADLAANKYGGRVATRFPPEPNGYLHIGHAKSICLNFGVAQEFGGVCHLRMDDTNPTTEDPEYVEAIQRDVRWLGFEWGENMFYASDYYERLYELGEKLIRLGRAYVCDLSEEQMAEYRGIVGQPGKESPYRDRSVEENLDRFRRMRKGEFPEGACVLRAKIDMTSPNMKMRDPPIYRIKHAHHYRTGDSWCIYPLYDFAHCLSDSMERITHSICTLEFESARELYDWVVQATEMPWVPKQTEFARLNLTYTVMSKRKLLQLVGEGHVRGWDDPRMPTLAGMRRRGYTPEAIRDFCGRVGVARNISTVDVALLEHTVREDLNPRSPRVLAVLHPLKVTIANWPDGEVEELDGPYWPHDIPKEGSRKIPFSGELYIDRDDFMEEPPKDFYRLAPGRSVRLRHGYIVTCTEVIKDAAGQVKELICSYDPATRGGVAPKGTKIDGTIHWVSAAHALDAEVRLYDRLFSTEFPGGAGVDFKEELNPASLTVVTAKVEPSLKSAAAGDRFQFERLGFFLVDSDSKPGAPVFNRTVSLKDSWAKAVEAKAAGAGAPKKEARAASPSAAKAGGAAPARAEAKVTLSEGAKALVEAHALTEDEASTLDASPVLRGIFDAAIGKGAKAKAVASLLTNDVLGELRGRDLERPPFEGDAVAELLALVQDGTLSTKLAKDVLVAMFDGEGSPRVIVERRGMRQIGDRGQVESAVEAVLAQNADAVGRYRAGNANVLGALVGLTMKATGGRANPKLVTEILKQKLSA